MRKQTYTHAHTREVIPAQWKHLFVLTLHYYEKKKKERKRDGGRERERETAVAYRNCVNACVRMFRCRVEFVWSLSLWTSTVFNFATHSFYSMIRIVTKLFRLFSIRFVCAWVYECVCVRSFNTHPTCRKLAFKCKLTGRSQNGMEMAQQILNFILSTLLIESTGKMSCIC